MKNNLKNETWFLLTMPNYETQHFITLEAEYLEDDYRSFEGQSNFTGFCKDIFADAKLQKIKY